jgi:4-hydroxy-2-oxoheptanedioate aldolase
LTVPGVGALDSGAHGIVVPLLYTPDDARRLVASTKFPPVGNRGFGSPFAMGSIGNVPQIDYLLQANDALLTIVQIETKEAFDNVGLIPPEDGRAYGAIGQADTEFWGE